jgi:hypothetical protein
MPDQLYDVASALIKAGQYVKCLPVFGSIVSTSAGQRISNALDNMRKYSTVFAQLEAATHKPNASDADWRKQVDAIIYAPMDDEAEQHLTALIESVDGDAKFQG